MPAKARHFLALALAAPGLLASGSAAAQSSTAHMHIGHVADAFNGTPQGQGLLATAVAEAAIVVQHAELALEHIEDLDSLKVHAEHLIHALDPDAVDMDEGPGLGYGVRPAAAAAANHIEMAGDASDASVVVQILSRHIATAALNTVQWADEIMELALEIREASEAEEAAELVEEILALANRIVRGGEDAPGLRQAEDQVSILKRAEGIGR